VGARCSILFILAVVNGFSMLVEDEAWQSIVVVDEVEVASVRSMLGHRG